MEQSQASETTPSECSLIHTLTLGYCLLSCCRVRAPGRADRFDRSAARSLEHMDTNEVSVIISLKYALDPFPRGVSLTSGLRTARQSKFSTRLRWSAEPY